MATREQLMKALRNADAAGDTAAAQQLARSLKAMPATGPGPGEPDYSKPPAQEPGLGGMIDAPVFAGSVPDVARVGIDAFSSGGADYMAGGDARKQTDEARQRLGPVASTATDLIGSYYSPNPFPKIKMGSKILKGAYHAGQGGVMAGLDAYGHGQSWPEIGKAAAVGTGAGAALSAVSEPVLNWMSRRKARADLPAAKDLKQAGRDKYEEVKAKGGVYTARDTRKLLAQFQNIDLSLDSTGEIREMQRWLRNRGMRGAISPDKLDKIRRIVSEKTRKGNDPVKDIGRQFIEGMDKFAENTPVKSASGAPIPGINDTVKAARKDYQQGYKLAEVEKAQPKKQGPFNIYGEASDTPSRNRFGKLEKKAEAPTSGWNPAEKQKLTETAQGSKMSAVGELARRFNPARSRIFAPITAAGNFFPGVGSIPTAVAGGMEVATQLGKASTAKQIADLKSIIATGGPITADAAKVAAAKDELSRILSAAVRTNINQRGPR